MTTALVHSWYLTERSIRNLLRQPWWIAISLAQPVIYLLFFGSLFGKVVEIPGFAAASYITFLTPGVVIMTALFGAGWAGMGAITIIERGIMDRFLTSPVSRSAIIVGSLAGTALTIVIQTFIVLAIGWVRGATYAGGPGGIAAVVAAAVLLALPIGALSLATGLVLRRQESVIGVVNMVLLPLMFLSSVFMAANLMPDWMQTVARYNPVDWAVLAARSAVAAEPDWSLILSRLGLLAVLSVICIAVASGAFRSYQRSV